MSHSATEAEAGQCPVIAKKPESECRTSPLADNPDHVDQLCSRLDIGEPRPALTAVHGGFHHKMWRLETQRGTYVVKQLSADIDLGDPASAAHYNVTESIAAAFAAQGVAAVCALRRDDAYLQVIDSAGYLVYPWCDGVVQEASRLSPQHAAVIAKLVAKLHRLELDVPEAGSHEFDVLSDATITDAVQRAGVQNTPHTGQLTELLPRFLAIAASHRAAVPLLQTKLVVSHGDLDPKNVLWGVNATPYLIDWESAGRLNPTYEIVQIALDWSGITTRFDKVLCRGILSAYKAAGGVVDPAMLEAAVDCLRGEWLIWLVYNIARTVDPDTEQRALGKSQIDLVLPTLLHLEKFETGILYV